MMTIEIEQNILDLVYIFYFFLSFIFRKINFLFFLSISIIFVDIYEFLKFIYCID